MNASRRAAIVRLLETRDDHLPPARAAALSTASGFVHRASVRESCDDCLANGRAVPGCVTCGGRGWVERRRGRDPYDTGQSSGWFGSSSRRHEQVRERDAEIERLSAQLQPPRPEAVIAAAIRADGWEKAREEAWARFDYGPLDIALDALRLVDEGGYHAVMSVHVYRWQLSPSVSELVVVERGLVFLGGRLPDPLRAPAEAASPVAATLSGVARDAEIRRMVKEGHATQFVARRFELSVRRVNEIVSAQQVRS